MCWCVSRTFINSVCVCVCVCLDDKWKINMMHSIVNLYLLICFYRSTPLLYFGTWRFRQIISFLTERDWIHLSRTGIGGIPSIYHLDFSREGSDFWLDFQLTQAFRERRYMISHKKIPVTFGTLSYKTNVVYPRRYLEIVNACPHTRSTWASSFGHHHQHHVVFNFGKFKQSIHPSSILFFLRMESVGVHDL